MNLLDAHHLSSTTSWQRMSFIMARLVVTSKFPESIYTISPPSNHWEFVLWSYLSVVSRKTFSSTDLSYHTSPWTCVGYIPPNALNMAYLQQVIKIKKKKGNGPPNQNKDNPHFRNKFRIILDISFFTSLTSRNNGLSNKQSKIRTKKSNQKSPFIQFFFPKKMMQVWHFCCIPSSWVFFMGDKNLPKLWAMGVKMQLYQLLTVQLVHGFQVFEIHLFPKGFLNRSRLLEGPQRCGIQGGYRFSASVNA